MNQSQFRKLSEIAETYGKNPQVDMAIEECSELIKALLKERRKTYYGETVDPEELRAAVIDEIADVLIMATQLEIIYSCTGEVEERIDYKIKRQEERIAELKATAAANYDDNGGEDDDYVSDYMMRFIKNDE